MKNFNFTVLDDFIEFCKQELMPKEEIQAHLAFRELSTWSSLNALIFVSSIHEQTGVLISSEDLAACISFKDLFEYIQNHLHGAFQN